MDAAIAHLYLYGMMKDIKQRREGFDQLGKLYPKEASVKIEQASINSVSTYWFTPVNARSNEMIIWVHGGAYFMGSVHSHGSLLTHAAHSLATTIVYVDYALAPEHPYPAGRDDVFAVYTALLAQYPGHKFSFIGDSAGGGLIVSVVEKLIQEGVKLPGVIVLISPWIDLAAQNASYITNQAKDTIISAAYLQDAANEYLGSIAIGNTNPANIAFKTFPPVLIAVGTNEVLEDDSRNFYAAVKHVQSCSTFSIYEGQAHVWPLADVHSEASKKLLDEVNEFLSRT